MRWRCVTTTNNIFRMGLPHIRRTWLAISIPHFAVQRRFVVSPSHQEFGLRIGSPMFKARSPLTHLMTVQTTHHSKIRAPIAKCSVKSPRKKYKSPIQNVVIWNWKCVTWPAGCCVSGSLISMTLSRFVCLTSYLPTTLQWPCIASSCLWSKLDRVKQLLGFDIDFLQACQPCRTIRKRFLSRPSVSLI
jgi:hypothetical protein